MGGRTNHRRRLLSGWHGIKPRGDIYPPTEHVGTRAGTAATPEKPKITTTSAASNTVSLQTRSKLHDKKAFSEKNKQFDPGGEGGEQPPLWNAAVMVAFSFPGGNARPGVLVFGALCSFSAWLSICCVFTSYFQVTTFQRAEKHERRHGSSR